MIDDYCMCGRKIEHDLNHKKPHDLMWKCWASEEMAHSCWMPGVFNDSEFQYMVQLLKKEWFR